MVGIFQCTGQVCSATSRLLIHESLEKELLERLLGAMRSITVGDPLQKGTLMGPVVSEVGFSYPLDSFSLPLSVPV